MKTCLYHHIFLPVLSLLLIMPAQLHAITATEIIKISEEKIRGTSQAVVAEMTVKTRRWERTMRMRVFEVRKERKSFTEVLAPKKDEGNRFLLIKHTMWHYVPQLQQTIKIAPSMMLQSWMGSDFTNDDIVKESSILEDYNHTLTGNEKMNGYSCYRIELKPKPEAAVVWGKIMYYARTDDCLPVKEEFYNEHGVLKKVLTFSDYKKMHDRVIPTVMKMVTEGKEGQYTMFRIIQARFNEAVPDDYFSLQYLKKR